LPNRRAYSKIASLCSYDSTPTLRFSLTCPKASSGDKQWLTKYTASIVPVLPIPAPQQTSTGLFCLSISLIKLTNSSMSSILGAAKSFNGNKAYSNPRLLTCWSSSGRSLLRQTRASIPLFLSQRSCVSLSDLALPASLPSIIHEKLAGLSRKRRKIAKKLHRDYFPFHCGFLFSKNAFKPSTESSVRMSRLR